MEGQVEGKDGTRCLVVFRQVAREPAAAQIGHQSGPGYAPPFSHQSRTHALIRTALSSGKGWVGDRLRFVCRVQKPIYHFTTRSHLPSHLEFRGQHNLCGPFPWT